MYAAFEEGDLTKTEDAFNAGLQHIERTGETSTAISWRAFYYGRRCLAGDAKAFDDLQALAKVHNHESTVAFRLGECLLGYRDYDQAAKSFQRAASLSEGDSRVNHMVRAARCLRLAKRYTESEELLRSTFKEQELQASPEANSQILRGLFETVKESGDIYHAFSIGERALQENPGDQQFRFSLGYAYGQNDNPAMAIFHYKLALGPDAHLTYNNLGVEYSNCNLPILSTGSYRKAMELGNTLAASNLARKSLGAGIADEATKILRNALAKEDCSPEVGRSLAMIEEQREEETKKEQAVFDAAQKHREFLISFSEGLLSDDIGSRAVGGWSFPFGEITLRLEAGELVGEASIEEPDGLVGLLTLRGAAFGGGAPEAETSRRSIFRFRGKVDGRTCHYHLTKETIPKNIFASGRSTTEGYVVFSGDCKLTDAVELRDKKLQDPYRITRQGPVASRA